MTWVYRTTIQVLFLVTVLVSITLVAYSVRKRQNQPADALIRGDIQSLSAMLKRKPQIATAEYQIGKVQKLTLLQLAAANAREDAISLLIRHGADVNHGGHASDPALHIAVQHNCEPCVSILLQNNADPNRKGLSGRTPIFWAVNKPRILTALLAAGADCTIRDDAGNTPLHVAQTVGAVDSLQLMTNKSTAGQRPN